MSELEKEQMAQKFSVLPDLWKKLEYAGDPFTHVWIIWTSPPHCTTKVQRPVFLPACAQWTELKVYLSEIHW